jgi:hypothetical protein
VLETLPWADFLSTQVANYEYNPAIGILLDQLQIRRSRSEASTRARSG